MGAGTPGRMPTGYSDQSLQSRMYAGDYEAAYHQNQKGADSMDYGNTRLQFGVKMIEDIDPGPKQGQMYVTTAAGKRLYFTANGHLLSKAPSIIAQGAFYGNGPAVSITGSPLNPTYHMFYAAGGDMHSGNQWTPIQINSKKDIMEAMRSGNQGRDINQGKYNQYYGQASINPWAAVEGADIWTNAMAFDRGVSGVLSQVIVPIAEIGLDTIVPGASWALQAVGVNKVLQKGIDSLVAGSKSKGYKSSVGFDPRISNVIKDPRLPGMLQQLKTQENTYISTFGAQDYSQTNKLAQDSPSQMITKGKQLAAENQDMWIDKQGQDLADMSAKLQQIVGSSTNEQQNQLFQDIKTGMSRKNMTNEQKINVINHFSTQIQSQILPLLNNLPPDQPVATVSKPDPVVKQQEATSSAQVGHPTLSINGTDSRHPGQTAVSGSVQAFVPIVPM